MPKTPAKRGFPTSVRAVPWAVLLEVAMLMRDRWMRLNPHDRAELANIVKTSKGRPGNLSKHERDRLSTLVRKLEPGSMGKDLIPHARRIVMRRGPRRFR